MPMASIQLLLTWRVNNCSPTGLTIAECLTSSHREFYIASIRKKAIVCNEITHGRYFALAISTATLRRVYLLLTKSRFGYNCIRAITHLVAI